jgi:RNA polymerase sigma factor (sigma-70 family)
MNAANDSAGDGAIMELAVSPDSSPEQRVAQADFADALEVAFATLPPEVRTVAVLYIVNGLPYKDIAGLTDAPLGTVMSRLARGRRLLRAALAAHVTHESMVQRPEYGR